MLCFDMYSAVVGEECWCSCACHTDMEVCLVVLSATSTCCVGFSIYHKGRVPVDPVHVTTLHCWLGFCVQIVRTSFFTMCMLSSHSSLLSSHSSLSRFFNCHFLAQCVWWWDVLSDHVFVSHKNVSSNFCKALTMIDSCGQNVSLAAANCMSFSLCVCSVAIQASQDSSIATFQLRVSLVRDACDWQQSATVAWLLHTTLPIQNTLGLCIYVLLHMYSSACSMRILCHMYSAYTWACVHITHQSALQILMCQSTQLIIMTELFQSCY